MYLQESYTPVLWMNFCLETSINQFMPENCDLWYTFPILSTELQLLNRRLDRRVLLHSSSLLICNLWKEKIFGFCLETQYTSWRDVLVKNKINMGKSANGGISLQKFDNRRYFPRNGANRRYLVTNYRSFSTSANAHLS